jgi:hypothetical protein
MQSGSAIIIEMPVTQSVPIMNGKKPKSPFIGFQTLDVISWPHESLFKTGTECMYRPTPINKTNDTDNMVNTSVTFENTLSLNSRSRYMFCFS